MDLLAAPAAAATIAVLRPGDRFQPSREPTPAERLIAKYRDALFAFPGVVSITWQPTAGDHVQLNYRTEADRQLGELVLEDAIDGVRLLGARSGWTGGSPDPDRSLWKIQAAVAAVNALPGVWNSRTSGGAHADGAIQFDAVNQATVDLLDPLVRDRIRGDRRPDGGTMWFDVTWRAIRPV